MVMTSDDFGPVDFDPPTTLVADRFRLEPMPWTSSIAHTRSTQGYPDGRWPPRDGMTLEENLDDLRRHADDFRRRAGFTFPVLHPRSDDVSVASTSTPTARRGLRRHGAVLGAGRSSGPGRSSDAVARWLAADWPWELVDRCGR